MIALWIVGCLGAVVACSGSNGAGSERPGLERVRLGGPADCASNPGCVPGLLATYGVDLSENLVTTTDQAATVAALESGEIEIGVVFSDSPYADRTGLRVLADDLGMIGAENVVPVGRDRVADAVHALTPLQEALGQEALRELNAAVLVDGMAPEDAAEAWLGERSLLDGDGEGEGTVRIGAQDLPAHQVLAHLYQRFLASRGFLAEVEDLEGERDVEMDAFVNDEIDLVPEYAASLLEFLNGLRGEAVADPDVTVDRLREYVIQLDAVVGEPAAGESHNTFVATEELAAANDLDALSDLQEIGVPLIAEIRPPRGPRGEPDIAAQINIRNNPTLGVGDDGPLVEGLQRRLVELGLEVEVTGVYDQQTRIAVVAFQRSQGLAPDGVVGSATRRLLDRPQQPVVTTTTTTTPPSPPPPPSPPTGAGNVMYLTFDDGPHPTHTPQILGVLAEFGVRATFFNVGASLDRSRDLGRRVHDAGHRVANHTWNHRDLRGVGDEILRQELVPTSDLIAEVTGRRERCFRPPYGATDSNTIPRARSFGLESMLWTIDTQDWRRPGASVIAAEIVGNARPGAVALMHDGGGDRSQTVAGVRSALEQLTARGYRFEVLPSC